jgi:predicted PurR-regulated permease PerM
MNEPPLQRRDADAVWLYVPASTVLKVILVFVGCFVVWEVREVLVICFVALILISALRPLVSWLVDHKWSRVVAAGTVVVTLIALVLGALYGLGAPLLNQMKGVLGELPKLVASGMQWLTQHTGHRFSMSAHEVTADLLRRIQAIMPVYQWMTSLLDLGVAVAAIVVLTFYVLGSNESLLRLALRVVPDENRRTFVDTVYASGDRLGAWVRGQLAVSLTIGILVAIASWAIGIPGAGAIGLLAGFFEFIPYVGPFLSGLVMVLMAATMQDDPATHMLFAFGAYVVVHFLENHFVIPKIMQRAMGLSPVLIIIAILMGGVLGGIIGTVLAVPAVAVIQAYAEATQGDVLVAIPEVAPMKQEQYEAQPASSDQDGAEQPGHVAEGYPEGPR